MLRPSMREGGAVPLEVVFMFPGVGEQYVGMGGGLYDAEAVFRHHFDGCAAVLRQISDIDLHASLYPERGSQPRLHVRQPRRVTMTHPALFATEYALAQLWISWGINPSAMIGHGLGEYAAACIAGVISFEDAIQIVARRASLIEGLAPGAMLAVALPEAQLRALLSADLSVAAVNAPSMCVAAGSQERVDAFKAVLAARGVAYRDVNSSHAFHSHMMDAIYPELIALFGSIRLQQPSIPYISNLTGDWITPEQVTDPRYWARHTCQTVRFADGIARLNGSGRHAFVEIGPGQSLASFLHQQTEVTARPQLHVLQSLPAEHESLSDTELVARSLSSLWCGGVAVEGAADHTDQPRIRLRPAETGHAHDQDHPSNETSRTGCLESRERTLNAAMAPPPTGQLRIGVRPAYIDPEGDIERMQAAVWSAILGVSHIGRDDDFFRLGGNSLIAMTLLNRVREALQLELPLKALFGHSTLRGFAACVEHALLEEIEALSDDEARQRVLALDGMREPTPTASHWHRADTI
jgi:phthiocerol/phenolphthiocerol synthesis type-I polyketide synthase E